LIEFLGKTYKPPKNKIMRNVHTPPLPLTSLHTPSTGWNWLADKADQALRMASDRELIAALGDWLCEVYGARAHSLGHELQAAPDEHTPCHTLHTPQGRCVLRIHTAEAASADTCERAAALVRICQSRLDQMSRQAVESPQHRDPARTGAPLGPQEQAFARAVQEGLTHAAMTEAPMACLLLELADEAAEAHSAEHPHDLTRQLRNSLRKHDALFELSQGRWGLLLHRLGQAQAAHAIVRRLQHDLAPGSAHPGPALQVGLALYPRDGRSAAELLHKAHLNLHPLQPETSGVPQALSPVANSSSPYPARNSTWH
jgi:hypothetical protein